MSNRIFSLPVPFWKRTDWRLFAKWFIVGNAVALSLVGIYLAAQESLGAILFLVCLGSAYATGVLTTWAKCKIQGANHFHDMEDMNNKLNVAETRMNSIWNAGYEECRRQMTRIKERN